MGGSPTVLEYSLWCMDKEEIEKQTLGQNCPYYHRRNKLNPIPNYQVSRCKIQDYKRGSRAGCERKSLESCLHSITIPHIFKFLLGRVLI